LNSRGDEHHDGTRRSRSQELLRAGLEKAAESQRIHAHLSQGIEGVMSSSWSHRLRKAGDDTAVYKPEGQGMYLVADIENAGLPAGSV
jgi:hypothetical protein